MTDSTVGAAQTGPLGSAADVRQPSRWIGAVVVSVSLVIATVTYAVLTGLTPIEPTGQVVSYTVVFNTLLVIALLAAIGREAFSLWRARQRGRAAARFHIRIVALFSLIAALPAILVAIFAFITLDRGLDRWFQERTQKIVDNAVTVAEAYLQEHALVLRGDVIAMATDVDRARSAYDFDPRRFDTFFETQARLRQMPSAYLLNSEGTIVVRTTRDPTADSYRPPLDALRQAADGEPVVVAPGVSNQVGAVIQLSNYDDMFLYVTRRVDPRVVEYMFLAQESASEYQAMSTSQAGVQVAFALVYTGFALVLLLSAVWVGIGFANRIVAPVRRLMAAADEVSRGNLQASVPIRKSEGDLSNLGRTFNNMISELSNQRNVLVHTNEQLDERRRFTEAVLAGVTAGVLGIEPDGRITLANMSASNLLDLESERLVGTHLDEVLPELAQVVASAQQSRKAGYQDQVVINLASGPRTFIVRVTMEREASHPEVDNRPARGSDVVVTLDDITDLVAAQRNAAWADVARRIAHEIKNPLTPIQLSAERLRRRFGRKIEDESGVFDQCVNTIIRQVGDIGRMVDEFSSFARMPKPKFEDADLRETIREAAFLQTVGHPDIEFTIELGDDPEIVSHDQRLMTQAMTNVIKNATEAVEAADLSDSVGRIGVAMFDRGELLTVEVSDNGIGFPEEFRQQLLEPYMTTRQKGTGLGLAIVRKIVEDHGGQIELADAEPDPTGHRGALVRLIFPKQRAVVPSGDEKANDSGDTASRSEVAIEPSSVPEDQRQETQPKASDPTQAETAGAHS